MATNRTSGALGPLLRAVSSADAAGKTDGQLLQLFLARQDEAAFTALVRRHGPMVLGVCRRILGNAADAADAFQAAFLILVRKAASLTGRSVLGDWLHGVARHTALKARTAAARRRAREQSVARSEAMTEPTRNDWLPLLDEQLSRLPAKYRLPLVLCDLEGQTRREAAAQLGWPEGTVAGRLARGHALLAKRLLRSAQLLAGVTPAVLAESAVQAALAPALIDFTTRAGTAAALSAEVIQLARGVMRSMFWQKMKRAVLVLLLAVVPLGVGGLTFHLLAGEEQPPEKPNLRSPEGDAARPTDRKPAEALLRPAKVVAHLKTMSFVSGEQLGAVTSADMGVPVRSVLSTPDGGLMAFVGVAKVDGVGYVRTLQVQETATGKKRWQQQGRSGTLAFSPDGKLLATCDNEQVELWEAATGKLVRTLTIPVHRPPGQAEPSGLIECQGLAFAPDSKTLALVGQEVPLCHTDLPVDSVIPVFVLWDVATGKELREHRGQNARSYTLLGFSGGKILAWESHKGLQGVERLIDLNGSGVLCDLGGQRIDHFASLSPDGKTCFWGSNEANDFAIRQWDVARNEEIRRLPAHNGSVTALVFSADGKLLASAGAGTIKVWNTATGKEVQAFAGDSHGVVTLAWSPDGKLLASGGLTGRVQILEVATGKVREQLEGQQSQIHWVAFSPDGQTLVSYGRSVEKAGETEDETILWDLTGRREERP